MILNYFLLLILFSFGLFGSPVLQLDGKSEFYTLKDYNEIYEDTGRNLDIIDIQKEPYSSSFVPIREENPNLGTKNSAFWIRFTIANTGPGINWVLNIPSTHIHSLELYKPIRGGFEKIITGNQIPFYERTYKTTQFTFDIQPEEREETYFIRVENTHDALFLPVYIESGKVLTENIANQKYLFGIYYGVMFSMFIYNLFVYISVREKTYLYYIGYLFFISLHLMKENGLAYKYLWPNSPEWNRISFAFTTPLASLSTLLFCQNFFDIKPRFPRLYHFMSLFGAFTLFSPPLLLLFLPFPDLLEIEIATAGLNSIFLFGFAVFARIVRFPSSTVFLVAWTFFLFGVLSVVLMNFNILPYNLITAYGVQIGNGLEATLLSLSIANKIRIIKDEKEHAQKLALEKQEESIENLRKIDKLKDEFLANTSHELKTPLHAIIGLSESMKTGGFGPVTPAMQETLKNIILSGNRLTALINDILDYSKLKHDDLKLNLQAVNLKNVLQLSLITCRALLGTKPIQIKEELPAVLPYVLADENRLQQIFLNLLTNALKFTSEGEIKISAHYEGAKPYPNSESFVTIMITDTGIGIPEEKLDLIFNSFEQVDGSIQRKYGGTGLGLSLTKKLVESHGGKIWVKSRTGEGSTFYFTLRETDYHPEIKIEDETNQTQIKNLSFSNSDVRTSSQLTSKSKILLVDDEVINIFILKNQLESIDYETSSAQDGYSALQMIEKLNFDLVLLDLMMPEISGYDVLKKIREKYSRNQLPVVILTAKNQINDIVEAFDYGANDYLSKPFSKDELCARVKIQLDLKRLNDDLEFKVRERTYFLELANRKAESLNQFTRSLNEQSDMKKIFIQISEYVFLNFKLDTSCLFLLDREKESLNSFRFYSYLKLGMETVTFLESLNFKIINNTSIVVDIFNRKKPLLLNEKFRKKIESDYKNINSKREILSEMDKSILQKIEINDGILVPLVVQREVIGIYVFSNLGSSSDISWKSSRELIGFCRHFGGTINSIRLLLQENYSKELILKEKTKALETLDLLRETQNQLVETTKVAALGQLVSSIAHEINTPIGAIKSTNLNIRNRILELVENGSKKIRNLDEPVFEMVVQFLREELRESPELSTREERILRKKWEKEFKDLGLDEPELAANIFSVLKIKELPERYTHLFKGTQARDVLNVVQLMGGIHSESGIIERSIEKTSKIIQTLRAYAGGITQDEKTSIDLGKEMDLVLKLYSNRIQNGITINKIYSPCPEIVCKREKIQQVLSNILHNAISALKEEGTIEIELKEETREGQKGIGLSIRDNGPGIPPGIQEKIFTPFVTDKNLGEGIGLGLYVSRQILQEHNGSIRFESSPGNTVFKIFLPV